MPIDITRLRDEFGFTPWPVLEALPSPPLAAFHPHPRPAPRGHWALPRDAYTR